MILAQIKSSHEDLDSDSDDESDMDEELKAKLEAGRKRAAELKKMIN